jgi:biopolymer transport protein ExbD
MITRPLELASKLRPEPRYFDWIFFINAGLVVLFFSLFGSRFVLAPGIGVEFLLPQVAGADANARPATHYVTVVNAGQIFAGDGLRNREQLRAWLTAEAKKEKQPSLLVQANQSVSVSIALDIAGLAKEAGFEVRVAAIDAASIAPKPRM